MSDTNDTRKKYDDWAASLLGSKPIGHFGWEVWQAATNAKDAEIAALRKELGNAKSLICEVHGLLPLRTRATDLIERKTGNWFAFGADRDKVIREGGAA